MEGLFGNSNVLSLLTGRRGENIVLFLSMSETEMAKVLPQHSSVIRCLPLELNSETSPQSTGKSMASALEYYLGNSRERKK